VPSPNDDVAPDDSRPLVTADTIAPPDMPSLTRIFTKTDLIFLTHTHPDHGTFQQHNCDASARSTGRIAAVVADG